MTFSLRRGLVGMLLLAPACEAPKGEAECPAGRVLAGGIQYDSLWSATESGAGGTVTVCEGVFPGDDYIAAITDIHVQGAGAEQTKFNGEAGSAEEAASVHALATYVVGSLSLSGVTLTGGASWRDAYDSGGAAGGLWLGVTLATLSDVEIRDNVADWGGGVAVWPDLPDGSRPEVTVSDSRIVRNTASWGGGAFALTGPSTVTLVNVDLGMDTDGNGPDDIAFFDGEPDGDSHEPVAVYQFDGVVSVTCVWETRTCE